MEVAGYTPGGVGHNNFSTTTTTQHHNNRRRVVTHLAELVNEADGGAEHLELSRRVEQLLLRLRCDRNIPLMS